MKNKIEEYLWEHELSYCTVNLNDMYIVGTHAFLWNTIKNELLDQEQYIVGTGTDMEGSKLIYFGYKKS